MSNVEPFQVEMGNDPLLQNKSPKRLSILKIILINIFIILMVGVLVIVVVNYSSSNPESITPPTPVNPDINLNLHSFTYVQNEGPLGNPLKGFAPWATSRELPVPVSLEFLQVKMIKICETEGVINTSYIETNLAKIAKRNRTAIVRFVLDDPGSEASPQWFLEKAKTNDYTRREQTYKMVNFNDEYVLNTLEEIITELGKKFDGDPRIAFWQLGTYGHWGEWHETYVEKSLKATDESKDRMMDMNLNNFKKTMCQVRRPEERSKKRDIGFYHDMFGNYDHGQTMDEFLNDTDTWDRWKTFCFGGEEDPDLQELMFGEEDLVKQFNIDLDKYHPTFLFDSDFYKVYDDVTTKYPKWMIERNKAERLMGYNYFVKNSTVELVKNKENDSLDVNFKLIVSNKGVAPFYYDWIVNFGLVEIDDSGNVVNILKEEDSQISIKGIQTNEEKVWEYSMKNLEGNLTDYSFGIRIPSKVNSFVRFANKEQLEDIDGGWFIVAKKIKYLSE